MNLLVVGGVQVAIDDGTVQWRAGLTIDADGSPHAYAPANSGLVALDYLADAGHGVDEKHPVANWYGVVTDTGLHTGTPIIQGPNDPAPGYYVSPTALEDASKLERDPLRYVNAEVVPYLAIPPDLERFQGARLLRMGDVAMVRYRDRQVAAILADVGPHGKLGEGSIALAEALGMDSSPKHGGVGGGVSVVVWRESAHGWPRSLESIAHQVASLMAPQTIAA